MPAAEGGSTVEVLARDEQAASDDATIMPAGRDPLLSAPAVMLARAVAAGVLAGGRALLEHREARAQAGGEVMNVDDAAAFLGVDRNTVYDAAGRDEIPHRRIGKRILLSRTQLVAWLGACKAARVGNG
jgi:excisionase family DNA binding protein